MMALDRRGFAKSLSGVLGAVVAGGPTRASAQAPRPAAAARATGRLAPTKVTRIIDFARVSLPNVGGITEMLKIMAVCDTHRVGIVPHFTGPIATAGHMHTMMAFPGQVLMEYNQGERPVPYLPEFLECRNGKVWPNDRPGLGLTVDERQLVFVEAVTEGAPGASQNRLDGSLSHW
jgi:L-alanine-DL-glutamate epimerase-like enolase superfamily enzyme